MNPAVGPGVVVRAYRHEDCSAVQQIERRAGERFREVGLDLVADHHPPDYWVLSSYELLGRAWVASDGDDHPVGYLLIEVLDGSPHIEQVSVDPDHQGRGVGRVLMERAVRWAIERGSALLTLNTYRDFVPWNAPLYRHLGFEEIDSEILGPELKAQCAREAAIGLEPALRVTMGMRLPP